MLGIRAKQRLGLGKPIEAQQDLFDAGAMRFDPFAKPSNKMVALAASKWSSLTHRRGRST
jgi:hypothetical protein